jgi:hypothetical protein
MRSLTNKKNSQPSCLDFSKKQSKAYKELEIAISHYKSGESKAYSFKVYKDEAIKYKLEQLFHDKCAYCETKYSYTQPVDIEHYRPKGAVDILDGNGKKIDTIQGYYWLAAFWENLLPSCIDCNRARNHTYIDENGESKVKVTGKQNLFPLDDESQRASGGNPITKTKISKSSVSKSISNEQPLLLNPEVDETERFFHYLNSGVVIPSPELSSDLDRKKALTSIDIYGLNRPGLVFSRKEVILAIEHQFFILAGLFKLLPLKSDDEEIVMELVSHILGYVESFTLPQKQYSDMARKVIDINMKKYGIE